MPFAEGGGLVAPGLQGLLQGAQLLGTHEGVRIGEHAGGTRIQTGGDGSARCHTDAILTIGAVIADAFFGQEIKIRCLDEWMAGATQYARMVFIREEEEHVRPASRPRCGEQRILRGDARQNHGGGFFQEFTALHWRGKETLWDLLLGRIPGMASGVGGLEAGRILRI